MNLTGGRSYGQSPWLSVHVGSSPLTLVDTGIDIEPVRKSLRANPS